MAETVSVIASDPALQTLRAQTVEAEKSMMELSGKFGPKHPAMQKAASDLEILRQKKAQEVRRIVQSIRIEYELALANEGNLRAQLGRSKSETLQLNERFIRYGALKREVDTSRQLYDALMLKLKEQSVNEENQPVNLWIIEEAKTQTQPVSPKKGLNILLGLVLGVFGGLGLALFVEYLDNKIKDPDETEATLDTPILGVVPLCREKDGAIEGIVLNSPLSSFAENYKTLRSALTLSTDEGTPRRILVTSPSMGEGKTSTTINLAMALAQTDKQVVLIDGDLRKPRLHQVFRTANDTGLSTYLAGATTGSILRKGPLPNLSLITSGPIPPNPAELVASQRLRSLVEYLSDRFDYIICDSPPLLMVADARVLSRSFDGTIVVVKAHQTSNELAARAVKSLRDLNARILGLVINGMHPRHEEYYYGEYHSGVDKPAAQTRYAGGAVAGGKST
jgi:capsular exopolysaccharide synthesis family protein